tara:strand:- start:603 stop:3209 length:2607 start_codon:yes stop_codon:yes gene_type:complete
MRASYARRKTALIVVLVLLIPLFPTVSATGQGLLLDSTSLTVLGDLEVGEGDVNISIDVQAHDNNSIGHLNFTLVEGTSTIIAFENVSLNMSAGEIVTTYFNITQLAIGQYTLFLQLYGDVGVSNGNYTDQISYFVKRLAPANISIADETNWQVTPVNLDNGEASGNDSFRDGDGGWAIVPITNSGEVSWNGSIGFSIDGLNYIFQNFSVSPLSSSLANFSIPQLSESNSTVLSVNLSGQVTSKIIVVGPPPLARINLFAYSNNTSPELGDYVIWTLNVSNNGELAWSGVLICNFSNGIILQTSLSLPANSNESTNITLLVRPGTLFCELQIDERVHDDSVINVLHVYDMDAAHFSNAGSSGIAIEGTNFHIGDSFDASIIVHNGGDFLGNAKLIISDSGTTSQGTIREFQVGNSLQLTASHILLGESGERDVSWAVISEDGLVDLNLSGIVSIGVNPSQNLLLSIESNSWDTSDGLSTDIDIMLSDGPSRNVQLNIGYSYDGDQTTVISSNVILSPGVRSLSFSLGHPSDADELWAQLVVSDWSASVTSTFSDVIVISPPNVLPNSILGVANPAVPSVGDEVKLSYTLSNGGTDKISQGVLILRLSSTNEILWEGSAPLVEASGSESGEIIIQSWPEGNIIDLELEWITANTEIKTLKSYPSKSEIISEDFEIPWSAIIYGAIAGIVIASIARFVFVWVGEDPEERQQLKTARRKARDDARSEARRLRDEKKTPKEKQEVPCPSCDMVLRVPYDYDGQARCPACTHVFNVSPVKTEIVQKEDSEAVNEPEPVKETTKPEPEPVVPSKSINKSEVKNITKSDEQLSSFSTNDEIRCPSCGQRLRVPFDKRPVTARCPRCEVKFIAEKN